MPDMPAQPAIGTVLTVPGAAFAELVAEAFDVVWIDMEHGGVGVGDMVDMIIGAQAARAMTLVRVPVHAKHLAGRALDAGADGLVLADVGSAAATVQAVRHSVYPPDGERGWGPRRLGTRHRHDPTSPFPEIWAQIESGGAVREAKAIAEVAHVSHVVAGCADLSWSLGVPMRFDSSELAQAVDDVRRACDTAGKAFGLAGPLDAVPPALLTGAASLTHSTDARLAAQAADQAAAEIRARALDVQENR